MSTPHSGPYPGGPGTVGTDQHLYNPVRPGTVSLGSEDPVQAYLQALAQQEQVNAYLKAVEEERKQQEVNAYLKALHDKQVNDQVMSDPEYAAWKAEMGVLESDLKGNFSRQRERLMQALRHARTNLGTNKRNARRGINTDAQNRGMFRSGKRLGDIGRSDRQLQSAFEQYRASNRRELSEFREDRARGIRDLRMEDERRQRETRERIESENIEGMI